MRRPAVHSMVGALLLKVGAFADQLTVGRLDPGSVSSRAPPFPSPGDSIFCDNEAELFMHGITFINGACCTDGAASTPQRSPGDPPQMITDDSFSMQSHQGAESCGNSALPATCSTFACARTVRRVRDSCSRYFARDAFSAGTRDQIAALNGTCDASVVAPPRVLGFQGLRGQTVANVCGIRLTDGLDTRLGSATGVGATSAAADSESLYLTEQMGVTFVAPPGRLLAMDFELVWFPPGVVLKVYDGFDNKSPLLGTFPRIGDEGQGVIGRFVTSDWLLYIETSFDSQSLTDTETVRRQPIGFSVDISCRCSENTPGSCGGGGRCVQGRCSCNLGYSGQFCEVAHAGG